MAFKVSFSSSKRLRLVAGIVISALSLYLALRKTDYRIAWAILSEADVWYIILALGSVGINTVSKAIRWKILMGEIGSSVPLSKLLSTVLIGQMLNTIVPVRIGELSRVYIIGGLGPGRIFVLGTIVLEKILDMLCYTLLFFLLLLLMPLPSWVSQPAYPFSIIAFGSFLIVLVLTYRQHWLLKSVTWVTGKAPEQLRERFVARIGAGVSSLSVLRNRGSNVRLGGWSSLIWTTAVLTNYLVLRALHIDAPVISAVFVLIVLQAGMSIPSAPGKIGIFEYLSILALGAFSIDRTQALSYGVLLHAIVFLPPTIIGVLLFWGLGLSIRQPVTSETVTNVR